MPSDVENTISIFHSRNQIFFNGEVVAVIFLDFTCLFLGLVFYILKQFPNNNNVEEIIKYIASVVKCDDLSDILDLITGLTKGPSTQWGLIHNLLGIYTPGIYKVSNGSARTMCEICSKLKIKIPERLSVVVLVSLLLTLSRFHAFLWCIHRCL